MNTPGGYITTVPSAVIGKSKLMKHFTSDGSGYFSDKPNVIVRATMPPGAVIPALSEVTYIMSKDSAYIISPCPQIIDGRLKTSVDIGGSSDIDVYVFTPMAARGYVSNPITFSSYKVTFPNGSEVMIYIPSPTDTSITSSEAYQLEQAAKNAGYDASASGKMSVNGITLSYTTNAKNANLLSIGSETKFTGDSSIRGGNAYQMIASGIKVVNLIGNKVYGAGSDVVCGYCNGSWRIIESSCTSIYEGAVT